MDRLDLCLTWQAVARTRLVDSTRLTAEPPPRRGGGHSEEEQRRERNAPSSLSGIVDYAFSPDRGGCCLDRRRPVPVRSRRAGGDWVRRDDAHGSVRDRPAVLARRPLASASCATATSGARTAAAASARSPALAVAPCPTAWRSSSRREEMDRSTGYWWSPDESRIAFARVDESTVDEPRRFEILADSVRVIRQRYPAAGRPNARVGLFVASLDAGAAGGEPTAVQVDTGAPADGYLARVDWFPGFALARGAMAAATRSSWRCDAPTPPAGRRASVGRAQRQLGAAERRTHLPAAAARIPIIGAQRAAPLYLYDYDGRLQRPVTAGSGW